VCTGALLLAAAGLLMGLTGTTHWRAVELFESLGPTYVAQRVVEHLSERLITAAGCPVASTWRCDWWSCSSAATPRRPVS
jgi:transcriptional regulator GlxA family with amidase domain